MPRGELIDPDTEMVVGAFSMETLQIEPIEPVPVRVAELLEGRGYRLRADRPAVASRFGSARRPRELSDGPAALPFVEILRPSQRGSPDRSEVLEAVECGNWLALQEAVFSDYSI
ncbi:unnamed protein product [Prorocentrum cordatum]|uniref:Uncharacterized protein n=1 Tax=Prorocentrum cordatum TaxID=2364126 RepID=A0ABN9QJ85_9DINO|nr:unnamed protein product [Polarella glacialis]